MLIYQRVIYTDPKLPNCTTSSPLSCHCRAQKTDIHGWAHDTASFNQRFLQHGWQKVIECDAPPSTNSWSSMWYYGIVWDTMGWYGEWNGEWAMGLGYPLWDMLELGSSKFQHETRPEQLRKTETKLVSSCLSGTMVTTYLASLQIFLMMFIFQW